MKNPLKNVYVPCFHISEPKFPTKISKALYSKYCCMVIVLSNTLYSMIGTRRTVLRNQFWDKLYKTVFDPSIDLFENNCPYMSKYLALLIKAEPI